MQTGTLSQCVSGALESNKVFWQVYHVSKTGGYITPGPTRLFDVKPGDHIDATVQLEPSNTAGRLRFLMMVRDNNTGQRNDKYFDLDAGVASSDALSLADCLVEAEPDGVAGPTKVPYGGLAKFSSPLQFTSCSAGSNGAAWFLNAYSGYETLYRAEMTTEDTGKLLAETGSLGPQGAFSVTWKNWR